ncbi:MAG: M1 family aminopeptidase [Thermoplasmata archaeon]
MIDQEFKPFVLTGYELQLEREKQFNLKRTVIDIKINFEERAVEGKVELDLKVSSLAQDNLEIDAADMEIYNVSVRGVPTSFDTYSDRIVVHGDFRAFSDYIITITYKSYPKRGGYFVEDEGGLQFWTHGQSTDNHAWFPCFDYPNTRSAYEIRVTVPRDYTVISNGKLYERVDGDFSTFIFKEDFRFPAYLVSVIAGKFKFIKQEWEGIPITSYFLPKFESLAERSFQNSKDMMEFISQKTGVKYPYSKYDQTCVSQFVMGGMENITATTLTDRTLHDEVAHLDYQSESLVCHEMAHQWFGDYVTCKDWSQAWLNEGFATFIALIYTEKLNGKDEFLVQVESTKHIYLQEYSERYGRPIIERKYKEPEELFDRHLYQKASLFLRYLNFYLGDKIFWSGVKEYLETNKMNGVSTDDFRKAISNVSGFSLERLFHQFLDEVGHPEFRVEENTVRGKVQIKITQTGRLFNLKVPVRIYYEGKKEDMNIQIDSKLTQLEFDRKTYRAFSLDPESNVLSTIQTEVSRETYRYILRNGESIIERARATAGLEKFGTSEIPFLAESFDEEKFWYVKGKIAESISRIGGEKASVAIRKMLDDNDYKVRREVAKVASGIKDEKLLDKLIEMFEKEKGYRLKANLIQSAQKIGGEKSKEMLLKGLETESYDSIIRVASLNALGELADISTLNNVKKYLGKKYNWQTRSAAISAVAKFYWKDRSVVDILLKGLDDEYFMVRENAANGIRATGNQELISKLSTYLSKEPYGFVKRVLREALEVKEPPVPQDFKSVKEELDMLKERVTKLESKKIARK